MGQLGRLMTASARAAGLPLETLTYRRTHARQQAGAATGRRLGDGPPPDSFDINIVCVNADELSNFVDDADPALFDRRYTIGVWAWETERFPRRWRRSFDLVDEVWGISEHTARAVRARASHTPVQVFPLPVEIPAEPDPRLRAVDRMRLGLPETMLFTFSFDYLSVFERKNPLATLEAYRRAFTPDEGATLYIKSINAHLDPANHRLLLAAAEGRNDIHIHDGYFSADLQSRLMRTTDVYVSLHRAEGFGLTIAEAMAYGLPVVATGYSGNMDFMTPETSRVVPYTTMEIPRGCDPYVAGDRWADPDVSWAAAAMRSLFEDPEAAAALGARARQHMIDNHSPAVRGALMRDRLVQIRSSDAYTRARRRPARVSRVRRSLADELKRRGARRARELAQRLLRSEFDELRADIAQLQIVAAQVDAVPYVSVDERVWMTDGNHRILGFDNEQAGATSATQDDYREFEAVFRGSEEFIRSRMAQYVDLLADHYPGLLDAAPVLDIGCGRGELLEVLQAHGARSLGIDTDPGMVRRCRDKGLSVGLGSGFEEVDWGASPEPSSVPGPFAVIFAIHVIEHLPPEEIMAFLVSARDHLIDGGVLVFETVNPNSLAALKTFWVDLTHRHPIYPEVAVTLCRLAGFRRTRIHFPHSDLPYGEAITKAGEFAAFAETMRAIEGAP